jgi:hypothetical protein
MIRIKHVQIAALALIAAVPCARAQAAKQSEDAESREANRCLRHADTIRHSRAEGRDHHRPDAVHRRRRCEVLAGLP